MSMLEKAARVLVKRNYPSASDADIDEMWQDYATDARAVLQAIREMDDGEEVVRSFWRCVIDKALEEG